MAVYLQKLSNLRTIIRQNGGVIGTFLKFFRQDEIKFGECVGEDEMGNKYFHNTYYLFGRSRWVEYSPKAGWDYDGSQIPAQWHGWLHYMSDEIPTATSKKQEKRKFQIEHEENPTATSREYVPYSTTRPRIQSWTPPSN